MAGPGAQKGASGRVWIRRGGGTPGPGAQFRRSLTSWVTSGMRRPSVWRMVFHTLQ